MLIEANNPDLENVERTQLSVPANAGVTSLSVKSTVNFLINDRVMVGNYGRERSEIVSITTTPTITALPVGALFFNHNTDNYVYRLKFDQVKFYRSTAGIAGSYSLLATIPIDVANEELKTVYDDTNGTSSYYYQISYYNSVTAVESQPSDPIPGAGYSRNTVASVIDEIQREVGDEVMNKVSRAEWLDWCNEINDDLQSKGRRPYWFLLKTVSYDATANTDLAYPTDMLKFDRLDYTWNIGGNSQTYEVRVIDPEVMRNYRYNNNAISSNQLQYIALDDSSRTIQFWPKFLTSRTGAISLRYYKQFTDITSDAQNFETPNSRLYKMGLLARFYLKRASQDQQWLGLSNSYQNMYNMEVMKLEKNQQRDAGSPRSFQFLPQTLRGNRRY